ncbi:MAG: AsmA family protein [Candidatus Margulisiibacteriota bacterium]
MKKILKWLAIILASVLSLLVIAVLALPSLLPLSFIKDYATGKISEAIHREVKIEKVSFSYFSGVKLENVLVSNLKGTPSDFIFSADRLELSCALWPLFHRQVIINSFAVKNGRIDPADKTAKTALKKITLSVSGLLSSLTKPIDFNFSAIAEFQGKEIPLSLNGNVGVNLADEKIVVPSLRLGIAGENANLSATLAHFRTSPILEASISSKKLAIDPLLAVFAAGSSSSQKNSKGTLTAQINKAMAGISSKYRAKLSINMENVSLQKFKFEKINANLSLRNKRVTLNLNQLALYGGTLTGNANLNLAASGLAYKVNNLKLTNFDATSFSNTLVESFLTNFPDYKDLLNKVYGKLNLACSFSGQGVEANAVLANLSGQGSFSLTNGEIKRLKTLAAVAEALKSNTLRSDIKFNTIQSSFSIRSRVVTCKDFQLGAGDIKAGFNGSIDLAGQNWVAGNRLTLKLSPSASQGLPKEYSLFRDSAGWFALDFEITGPLRKPFPKPILDRPIEAVIGKFKVTIDAKKVEIEQKANEVLRKFLSP